MSLTDDLVESASGRWPDTFDINKYGWNAVNPDSGDQIPHEPDLSGSREMVEIIVRLATGRIYTRDATSLEEAQLVRAAVLEHGLTVRWDGTELYYPPRQVTMVRFECGLIEADDCWTEWD